MLREQAQLNCAHERSIDGLITKQEKKLLTSIAQRLPYWVCPDHLTILGLVGSSLVFVCLLGSHVFPLLFWGAIAGLVVNWFGDSLDGTLARVRGIERRRYGFYVDHVSDLASQLLIILGLGLSPLMHLEFALLALVGYLALSVMSFVKLHVLRDFQLSYFGIGPTEVRLIICIGLLVPLLGELPSQTIASMDFTLFDAGAGLAFVFSVLAALLVFFSEVRRLAAIDPPRHGMPSEQMMTELEPFAQINTGPGR